MQLLLAALLCAVLLGVLLNRIEPPEPAPPAAPPPPTETARVGPTILEGKTLDEVRARLDDAYRLAPDRRFLLAVEEVEEMLGVEQPASATSAFAGGSWSLAANGTTARVGEYPEFRELLGFVRACAETRLRAEPAPFRATVSGGDAYPADPIAALDAIDRGETIDLGAASHAYASLLLRHEDTLETSDEVAARAIAVLALAEHFAGHDLVRPRALIAFRLGYEREAEEMAAALAPSDPTRMFVERDEAALRERALAPDAPVDVVLMYAHLLARSGMPDRFTRFVASLRPEIADDFGILALDAAYGEAFLPDRRLLVHAIVDLAGASGATLVIEPHLLLAMVAEEAIARLLAKPPYGLVGLTESMLADIASKESGRLLDPATRAAIYRARAYTGFHCVASDLVARLDSASATEQFAALLGRGQSATAEQFERYLSARMAAAERRLGAAQIAEHLEHLAFGPLSLDALFEPMVGASYHEAWPHAIKLLVQRADTRVHHREMLAYFANAGLWDTALTEHLGRSVAREWPHVARWHVLLAYRDGDLAEVRKWLLEPSVSPSQRAQMIPALDRSPWLSDDQIRRLYEQLIEIDPAEWSVSERYADYLAEHGAYPEMQRVVERWFAHEDRGSVMAELAARTALARAYHEQGRLAEAWQAVAAPLDGMYGEAFRRAALIQLDAGHPDVAEAICRAGLARYPASVFVTARLARVFWHQGRDDEAAAVLRDQVAKISFMEWVEKIGPDFVEEFTRATPERVDAVLASLLHAGLDPAVLDQLAFAADRAELPALGARIVSAIPFRGPGSLDSIFHGYGVVKKLRGREEALRWVAPRVPAMSADIVATYAFGVRAYDLTWDLVQDPVGHADVDDYVWILRGASYLREGATRSDWRARLDAYYASAPASFYNQIGGMLVDRVEPSTVWSAAQRPDQRVEAAYFIALRAEAAGDLEQAIAWYRIALEGGLRHEGESGWSLRQLYTLTQEGKSVARLRAARGATDRYAGT